jgi:hypothetical protein
MAAEDWSADCPFQSGGIARAGDRWPAGRPRSGDASVAVMESADLRDGDDPATWRGFDDSWLGTVVVKRLVWPRGVVVGEIRAQDAPEMSPAQNDEASSAGELHPRALPEPYVSLSTHTAPINQPSKRLCPAHRLLLLPVGRRSVLVDVPPSLHRLSPASSLLRGTPPLCPASVRTLL